MSHRPFNVYVSRALSQKIFYDLFCKLISVFVSYTHRFGVATSGAEAEKIATDLHTKNLILKAQVLAGGRGKGHFKNGLKGGVRVINK